MNTLTTASNELTDMLPWPLSCKLACRAMVEGLTMKEQIEFSLRQGLAQVESEKPRDRHRENAASLFDVSASAVTPEQRRYAKVLAFGADYGPQNASKEKL